MQKLFYTGIFLGVKHINFTLYLEPMPDKGTHTKETTDVDILELTTQPWSLIVWNDEVNTFEWVIDTLVEVCGHTIEQAEQCAMIIHTQGKYAVKHGDYDTLKPMCDAITERGIGATIEVMAE